MSRLDELPPDQRAALSLLLSQRKTYAEVATLLAIQERAVHDRAHAALALLAPRQARGLPAERREELGDYLLGQQPEIAERLATRAYLDGSDPAREWARAISGELAGLAARPLPEIPEGAAGAAAAERREAPAVSPSPPPRASAANGAPPEGSPDRSLGERLPSSRLGGALLLAAIAVAVIAVVLITGASSGSHPSKSASRSPASAKTTTGPAVAQRLTLTSPTPGSKAVAVIDILAEGSRRAFFIDAENLPESKGFFYALWLYNSPTSHRPLSASPPVGSTHRLQGGALLPSDAASYHTVLLTRERTRTPTEPGPIVLSGPFSLGA
jgi:hypothetical protein